MINVTFLNKIFKLIIIFTININFNLSKYAKKKICIFCFAVQKIGGKIVRN